MNNIIRVFLVDDHILVRSGLKFLLEDQDNIKVVGEASDAYMAFRMLNEVNPDIVIMDISMPGLNGIDATIEIKGMFPDIKVLILTMHDDEQLLFDVVKAGGSGYILKDSPGEELINAINSIYLKETFIPPHITNLLMTDYLNRIRQNELIKDKYKTLTKREKEILNLIAERLTNDQISQKLAITVRTVEAHRASLIEKLQINSRLELIDYARRKQLIKDSNLDLIT